MSNTELSQDPVCVLVDELCRIPSDVDLKADPPRTEETLARHVFEMLLKNRWLHITIEEIEKGRFNVLAADCAPEDIELLIVGHLDTVPMSGGWTVELGSFKDGKYYNLGAGDTKGGIAAVLDAIPRVGPTTGVGYLFYCDEEYHFLGMTDFLRRYPQLEPELALSVCGGPGTAMTSCRGLLELEITVRGVSGHASRQHLGCSAIQALMLIVKGLEEYCLQFKLPGSATAFNLAAIKGGGSTQGPMDCNGPPPVAIPANKIPDLAWALVDIRPGSPDLTPEKIRDKVESLLTAFNQDKEEKLKARLERLHFTHSYGAYDTPHWKLKAMLDCFEPVYQGRFSDPEKSGYLDAAELASKRGTALVCLAPMKGEDHAPDEFVDLDSLIKYRDACVQLLSWHKK